MKLLKGPKKLTLSKGGQARTETGIIKESDINDVKFGEEFEFNKQKFKVLKPRINDLLNNITRGPQIITPKDFGMILAYTGLGPGDRVLEAGAGSGALTLLLSHAVGGTGRVYSYELRQDFVEIVKKNLELASAKNVELKNKDITLGIDEKDLDVIILDLPEPWHVIKHALGALTPGGFLVCYVPTTNQLIELARTSWNGFFNLFSIECVVRGMNMKPNAVRPVTKGLTHTGYLVFARKG